MKGMMNPRSELMERKQYNPFLYQKTSRTGETGPMSQPILRTVLESTVKIEQQSYSHYTDAQGRAESESSIARLDELARAELAHKEKLHDRDWYQISCEK